MGQINDTRKSTLMALLVYGRINVDRESDKRLKSLMGMVELGELSVREMHGDAAGVIRRQFGLTTRGRDRAHRIMPT